jgi:hypothetical protein
VTLSGAGAQPAVRVEPPLPDCGCCQGVHARTPALLDNPPGAPTLRYRVGTQATFLAAMQATAAAEPALRRLRARRTDDPAVALLDAWACVLDVLTFYTERIANESYLRTATEIGSLVELARTVGYERAPGLAASAWLAFTLEEAPGSPPLVPVPTGTRVASLPGPGEQPQNFETLADLDARPRWNALRARASVPAPVVPGVSRMFLAGVVTDLGPGDALLVVGLPPGASLPTHWGLRTVRAVTPLPAVDVTLVEWDGALDAAEAAEDPTFTRVLALRQRAALFGHNAPDFRILPDEVQDHYQTGSPFLGEPAATATRATAPPDDLSVPHQPGPDDWPNFTVVPAGAPADTVDLDAAYPKVAPGSWLVLEEGTTRQLYNVTSAEIGARSDFALSGKRTRVALDGTAAVATTFAGGLRTTVVLAQSEELALAAAPRIDPVQGDLVELEVAVPPLPPGRALLVSGRRPRLLVPDGVAGLQLTQPGATPRALVPGDELVVTGPATTTGDAITWPVLLGEVAGTVVAGDGQLQVVPPADGEEELVELAFVGEPAETTETVGSLRLAAALAASYDRGSLRVAANVAPASHGETRTEVLGGGDATAAFQRFQLAQAPLTYVAAPGPGGVVSTLEVRVDGLRWEELPSLFGAGPDDRVYVVRADDDGKVTVTFGDGVNGARLPTGQENVTATYRVGIGLAGSLDAARLTLPLIRPLGVRSVTNPLPTGLAADPDPADALRRNAPKAALGLDRVVSLTDYEDFARATAGIGKAQASWLWRQGIQVVHLTVAGEGGQPVDEPARAGLVAAVLAAGDPHQAITVDVAELVRFDLAATLFVDPLLVPETVVAAAQAALAEAFGFDARGLGQPVTGSEVTAVAQGVAGVVALTLTDLRVQGGQPPSRPVLVAGTAFGDGVTVYPAQLLLLGGAVLQAVGAA